ncbi:TIGR03571 family LLM class oxidoreductase [Rhizobium miluonense]|uniref:Luciferase-type oxidoreductase, BA3436 family n=1 Tax=Rhizobium miluonense TaxID=411945 RepID=A0A1C3W5X7_9HYPH|nr:TIGR03571 family LLM class oxidoreductase [Rhizobium miluonense]SCB35450.1 luciferase-type oxidoreductase, BA3436 family [Rhizobium miluonense]
MFFHRDQLSFGIVLPAQTRTLADVQFDVQLGIAGHADRLGFDALWVRDVPLNSESYPDPIGHADPWVFLGALATATSNIRLATGAIVLPLRHPLHIAKASLSVAALSKGRFVLGLGSGDRPSEYEMFGRDVESRKALFQTHWERLAAALRPDQAVINEDGQVRGDFAIRPSLQGTSIPMVAVGSSAQSLEWIARNAAGWMTYYRSLSVQKDRLTLWRNAQTKVTTEFRGFGQSMVLELLDKPDATYEEINLGGRTGRRGLIDTLSAMREAGIQHVAFNLISEGRPATEVMDEIAADIMPALR